MYLYYESPPQSNYGMTDFSWKSQIYEIAKQAIESLTFSWNLRRRLAHSRWYSWRNFVEIMSIHPKRNKNIYVLNDSNVVIIVDVNTIAYWDFAEILKKIYATHGYHESL